MEPDEDSGGQLITFEPFHLRPLSRAPLDRVHLLVPPSLAGTVLTLRWEATGDAIDGRLTGTVDVEVGVTPIDGRAVLRDLVERKYKT